jgi:hypothetical protein
MRTLGNLLQRYCSSELDQWELIRVSTAQGEVYLELTRRYPDGRPADLYVDLDDWIRGRP